VFSQLSQLSADTQLNHLAPLMGEMLVAVVLGLILSFCLEQFHSPRPQPVWRREPAELLLHAGIWLIIFLVEFLQFRRPWLALCLTSTIFYVLVLINHSKFRSLREPFLYQDFEYFLDAIKHPRLYLPFFGFWKIAICLLAVALALWIGVSLESPLSQIYPQAQLWIACVILGLLALALILAGTLRKTTLIFNPAQDFRKYGLIAMLWHYARAEYNTAPPVSLASYSTLAEPELNLVSNRAAATQNQSLFQSLKDSELPDTVVVQSESFFDPRRVFNCIAQTVLQHFDQACQSSLQYGTLCVPAWGANTVRTEFEFLTGIATTALGIDQFNPYRRCVRQGLPSIASEFKKRGYRTVCVHPYPASFYQRDKIFPLLGFDEFIDIKSFDSVTQNTEPGPYVSDQWLTTKVLDLLSQEHSQPLFVFVITMENHGPLHLEPLSASDTANWVNQPLSPACRDLAIYLRHLANADQMIHRLIKRLSLSSQTNLAQGSSSQRPGQLLWYGDHVPVLPAAYDLLGLPDGRTDYFLWRSQDAAKNTLPAMQQNNALQPGQSQATLAVHQLAAELLK